MADIDVLLPELYSYRGVAVSKHNTPSPLAIGSYLYAREKAKSALEQTPALANLVKHILSAGETVFEAVLTPEEIEALENGTLKFGDSHIVDGTLYPRLYEIGDNGKEIRDRFATLQKSVRPNDVMPSLTSFAMQQQVQSVKKKLDEMNETLGLIEQGQRNDRIALCLSARQQYIEALTISDPSLQRVALMNAARTANDARFQLMQTMLTDIDVVVSGKGKISKKKKDEINANIREALVYVNDTTLIVANAHSLLGERDAFLATLMSYKVFIEEAFLTKTTDNHTYAEILYDHWNILKNGADFDWRKLPLQVSHDLQSAIDNSEFLTIPLHELYQLDRKVVLTIGTKAEPEEVQDV